MIQNAEESQKENIVTKVIETVDSDEELYMTWWFDELKENGFIHSYKREPLSFNLSSNVEIKYNTTKELKTKTKVIESKFNLLQPHVYTPDFKVEWLFKSLGIFVELFPDVTKSDLIVAYPIIGQGTSALICGSYIEVKPLFDQNNMTRLFRINQKWVYEKYKQYINEVIPQKLFEATFTPKKFLLTTKSKKRRTINFKVRTLEQYISTFTVKPIQQKLF